jgi:hypothetical protein
MHRKRAKKADSLDAASTNFARWRLMLGLTQDEAARILGKGRRTVQDYERATDPAKPSYTDRIVMDMIAKKQPLPIPWPE